MRPVNFSPNGIDNVQTSFYAENSDAYYFELDEYTYTMKKKTLFCAANQPTS